MDRRFDIAVAGATGLVGEVLLDILVERDFPVGEIYPLASRESSAAPVTFHGRKRPVGSLEDFDFSRVQLAFFATEDTLSREHGARAAEEGAVVIDASVCHRFDERVPLVVPEINPLALADFRERNIISMPSSASVALGMVLSPLAQLAGLRHVSVSAYQPVSAAGRAGVEELARQTAELLNGRQVKPQLFGRQIAFNCQARTGEPSDSGYTRDELTLVLESRRLLGLPELALNVSCVRVPAFFGDGLTVHMEMDAPVGAGEIRSALENAPGIRVYDDSVPEGYATAVTEAVGCDSVFVSRIREDISRPQGISLWIVSDNLRKGAALNGVQIAELLIKDYL